MPIEFAEDLLENDNFVVSENGSGDLIQEHKPSGAQFKFDTSLNRWVPVEGLDLDGSDIDNVGSLSTDRSSVNRQSGKFGQTLANNTPEGSRVMLAGALSSASTFENWIYLGAEANTNLLAFGRIGRADLNQTSFVLRASNAIGTSTLDVISGDASFFQVSGDWIQLKSDNSSYGLEVYLTVIVGALVA